MERPDFLKKCKEVCLAAGKDLPEIAFEKAMSFAWEIMAFGGNDESTKETLAQSCAEMYIALMAVSYLYQIDGSMIDKYVEMALGESPAEQG